VVLILDDHATHVTPRVVAYAGSHGLSLIRLVPRSSNVAEPFDLCVLGLFEIIYYKKRKSKAMKGETRKMYRALLVFEKATIIPMVRWSFKRTGFRLDLKTSEIQPRLFRTEFWIELVFPTLKSMTRSFTLTM
jgi:hypothetical protein